MSSSTNSRTNDMFTLYGDVIEYKDYTKHPKCLGTYDEYTGDYDCGYYTTLTCEECKYGVGRKDPAAKCNTITKD